MCIRDRIGRAPVPVDLGLKDHCALELRRGPERLDIALLHAGAALKAAGHPLGIDSPIERNNGLHRDLGPAVRLDLVAREPIGAVQQDLARLIDEAQRKDCLLYTSRCV